MDLVAELTRSETRLRSIVHETPQLKHQQVADPGEEPGGPPPPLFLDENEVRRAENIFVSDRVPPSYLRVWMTVPPAVI